MARENGLPDDTSVDVVEKISMERVRKALAVRHGLPDGAAWEDIDAAARAEMAVKHGLPDGAAWEDIDAAIQSKT